MNRYNYIESGPNNRNHCVVCGSFIDDLAHKTCENVLCKLKFGDEIVWKPTIDATKPLNNQAFTSEFSIKMAD